MRSTSTGGAATGVPREVGPSVMGKRRAWISHQKKRGADNSWFGIILFSLSLENKPTFTLCFKGEISLSRGTVGCFAGSLHFSLSHFPLILLFIYYYLFMQTSTHTAFCRALNSDHASIVSFVQSHSVLRIFSGWGILLVNCSENLPCPSLEREQHTSEHSKNINSRQYKMNIERIWASFSHEC